MREPDQKPEVLRRYSPRLVAWFARWLRGYFRRNFDSVRTSLSGALPEDDGNPLVVYTNHPSWWDPIHFLLLARLALPDRRMFGPFDADALAKYKLFRRLGAFGVDRSSRRGVVEFLVTCRSILATPDEIEDDQPLFVEGLGLDSIDALELSVALEADYGINISDTDTARAAFASIDTLAEFVAKNRKN